MQCIKKRQAWCLPLPSSHQGLYHGMADSCNTLAGASNFAESAIAKVQITTSNKWSSVCDCHCHGLAIVWIAHQEPSAKWQVAMGSSKTMSIEAATISGLAAMKAITKAIETSVGA